MQTGQTMVAVGAQKVLAQVRKVVVGKDQALLWALATILARGHILLEDIPGVGKTTMAVAFSKVLGLTYNRVQFTPDVLPSDVTGYSVLDQATGKMTYREGAVLCNLFLADELNRATSRTQSALLEAMEEGQVTVDGTAHKLPQPFVVIATQNPTGAAGTQLLPDSQMDRFTIRMSLGYPSVQDETAMVLNRLNGNPMTQLEPLMSRENLIAMQDEVAKTCNDEFMWGDKILVAPVVLPGMTKRMVYLPEGETWIEYATGKRYEGGQIVEAVADLGTIPVFLKKGSKAL